MVAESMERAHVTKDVTFFATGSYCERKVTLIRPG